MTMGATCIIIAWTENHFSSRSHGSWWIDFTGPITKVSVSCNTQNSLIWNNSILCVPACSAGYNLSTYPQFGAINSQVVEQSNALLKRIKSTVSYMSATNFVNHCALFFWYHNKIKHWSIIWYNFVRYSECLVPPQPNARIDFAGTYVVQLHE